VKLQDRLKEANSTIQQLKAKVARVDKCLAFQKIKMLAQKVQSDVVVQNDVSGKR
jgi:hypothetical protein